MKDFESKVKNTIRKYKLLSKKDNVIVACSGGKDSTTVLYLLNKFGYNIQALFLDVGIPHSSEENKKNLQKFCDEYGIKLNIVSLKDGVGGTLPEVRAKLRGTKMTNCAICGVLKRYLLNKKARELGATKLATGHNLDDEAENILLNIFGGNLQISLSLGPISGVSKDSKFVTKIKPLYECTNSEVKEYTKKMRWEIIYCDCPFNYAAFRKHIRGIIRKLEVNEHGVKKNIVNSFMKSLPKLRRDYGIKGKVKYCSICGEPSRQKHCKKCELIRL